MAPAVSTPKSLALIHNTALPHPLGVLSIAILEFVEDTCTRTCIPSNYNITILDLADYDFTPPISSYVSRDGFISTAINKLKTQAEWEEEISRHDGFLVLFPYHTWSFCNPVKAAFSSPIVQADTVVRKPILLLGFGQQEPYCEKDYERTWKRKSFPMMKDFFVAQGMKVVSCDVGSWVWENEAKEGKWEVAEGWPEYEIYADYWEHWIMGGYNAFLGGQQIEAWERRGWDRGQEGVRKVVDVLEGRKGPQKKV